MRILKLSHWQQLKTTRRFREVKTLCDLIHHLPAGNAFLPSERLKYDRAPLCSASANHEENVTCPLGRPAVKIRKAVITAAGRNQRNLPLQTLVDRDGQSKSALTILLEEVLQAGIEEIGLVICPGDQRAFAAAAGPHANRVQFIEQPRRWVTATPCPVRAVHRQRVFPAPGRRPSLRQPK